MADKCFQFYKGNYIYRTIKGFKGLYHYAINYSKMLVSSESLYNSLITNCLRKYFSWLKRHWKFFINQLLRKNVVLNMQYILIAQYAQNWFWWDIKTNFYCFICLKQFCKLGRFPAFLECLSRLTYTVSILPWFLGPQPV